MTPNKPTDELIAKARDVLSRLDHVHFDEWTVDDAIATRSSMRILDAAYRAKCEELRENDRQWAKFVHVRDCENRQALALVDKLAEALREAQGFIEDGSPLPAEGSPYYHLSETIDAALALVPTKE